MNYGGIGAVIGHEIGHGFDDQGSKYDGDGNMKNWWTDADRKEFEKRAKMLIEQYNGFSPAQLPGQHVNGALTIGENIGDLGGLTIAYKAYKLSLNGTEAPVLDAGTGDQRFFLGWAQVWRSKYRDAELIAPAGHGPPFAHRVPLQRRRPQPPRVLRRLRRQGGRQALAPARPPRPDLVKIIRDLGRADESRVGFDPHQNGDSPGRTDPDCECSGQSGQDLSEMRSRSGWRFFREFRRRSSHLAIHHRSRLQQNKKSVARGGRTWS